MGSVFAVQGHDEVLLAKTTELKVHPQLAKLYGGGSETEFERLRDSIARQGIRVPLEVAARDVPVFGGYVIAGGERLEVAKELGLETVPVHVRGVDELSTAADVHLLANALSIHKGYTESQRAAQEAALLDAIRGAPITWQRARGYLASSEGKAIAAIVNRSERSVRRRRKVFFSASTTTRLKDAVDAGAVSLSDAEEILNAAERAFAAGTPAAKRAVDRAVAKAIRGERANPRPRRPQARDERRVDESALFNDVRARILEWIKHELGESARRDARMIERALDEFRVDVGCAIADLRRALRASPASAGSRGEIDLALGVLGLSPIGARARIDLVEVKRAHRRLVRETHPDLNGANPQLAARFQQVQAAYERIAEWAGAQHA